MREIIKVVKDGFEKRDMKEAYTGSGKMINSDFLNNMDSQEAKKTIIKNIVT